MSIIFGPGFRPKDPMGILGDDILGKAVADMPGLGLDSTTTKPAETTPQTQQVASAPIEGIDPKDWNDLVDTVIAEAGGEGPEGMAAVAHVIRNRATRTGDVGDVIRRRAQFEGYENPGPGSQRAQRDPAMRQTAEDILRQVWSGELPDPTGHADHFHASYVSPSWANNMQQTTQIGGHLFYRAGTFPGAGRRQAAEATPPIPEPRPDDLGRARGGGGDPEGVGMARLMSPAPAEQPRGGGGNITFNNPGQDRLEPPLMSALTGTSQAIGRDLTILSGYRPPTHEVEARKRQPGQHARGTAADIDMRGMSETERARLVAELQARGVLRFGLYSNSPNMLHVDLKDQTGGGDNWFMYDRTNRNMNKAPQWFRDLADGKGPRAAAVASAEPLILDDNFQFQDRMGLVPRQERRSTPAVDAEAPPVDAANEADDWFRQLDERHPGRFELIPADQYETWLRQWQEAQQPDPLTSTGWASAGLQAIIEGAGGSAAGTIQGIGILLRHAGADTVGSLFDQAGQALSEAAQSVGPEEAYRGIITDILAGMGSMGIYLAAGWGTAGALTARGVGAGGQMLGGTAVAVSLAGPAGSAEAYNRAVEYGLSEEEALERSLPGFGAGAVQVAPVALILRAIPPHLRGNAIAQARHVIEAGVGEFVAEGFGAVLQNLIEQQYNEEKGIWDDTLYQAAIGGSAGALTQLGVTALTRGRGGPVGRPQQGQSDIDGGMGPEGAEVPDGPRGPLTDALEHGETEARRQAERQQVFTVDDPAIGDMEAGPFHGQDVTLADDQSGVPEGMRRVVRPDGSVAVVGDRILRGAEAEPARPAIPAGQAPEGAPAIGAQVRVEAEGVDPFAATIEGYEDGDALVLDMSTGEVLQVPIEALRPGTGTEQPPAPAGTDDAAGTDAPARVTEPVTPERPVPTEISRGMRAQLGDLGWSDEQIDGMSPVEADTILRENQNPDIEPVDPNDPALEPAEPQAREQRTEMPPRSEQMPVTEAFPGPPPAGSRVIVDAPGIDRFPGRIERYEDGEAIVVDDDGTPMQVPIDHLYISRLTRQQAEQQELQRNPPIQRERATGPTTRDIPVAKNQRRQVILPDDMHARLYDLGAARRQAQRLQGATSLERDRVTPAEQRKLAEEFGVDPQQIGVIADDYRYRVERAARKQREGGSPSKIARIHPEMLKRFRGQTPQEAATDAREAAAPTTEAPNIETAAHEAATSPRNDLPAPSEAQIEAGNYRKGHVAHGGLDLSIENPAGSTRSGKSRSGKPWSVTMKSHYGYIKGTKGKDKDHIDVFLNPRAPTPTDADPVYVVDQRDPSKGRFDEHKVMLGYGSEAEARAAYMENYSKGWKGLGDITPTTLGEFKSWLKTGDTTKPFAGWSPMRIPEKPVADKSRMSADEARASDVYSQVWDEAAADPTPAQAKPIWWEQIAEQIVNPNRYHPVVEEANPHGLKIGDTVSYRDNADWHVTSIKTQGTSLRAKIASRHGFPIWPAVGDLDGFTAAPSPTVQESVAQARKASKRREPPARKAKEKKAAATREKLPEAATTPQEAAQKLDEMFSKNKLFTAEKVEAARKRLRSKLGQINSGIDPEVLIDGMTIAGAYIEAGVRNFADYAGRMRADFGDGIKPYLLSFWEGARNYPGIDNADMTSPEESARLHAELNRELPASEAPALGAEMAQPKKRTAKRGRPEDRTITDDWGVDHIDAYSDEGEQAKEAFLKEGQSYLRAVADILSENGFQPRDDSKGRPMKPVSKNEAGIAVSGEVTLSMVDPESGREVMAQVGGGSLRGVVPTTKSGVSILFRAGTGSFATGGTNRWAPTTLTAGELAAMMIAEARGRVTPADMARPAQETVDGRVQKLDQDGGRALEGAPSEAVRGDEEGRQAGRGAAASGQPDLFGGQPARGERVSAGRSVPDGAGAVPAAEAGGRAGTDARPQPDAGSARGDEQRAPQPASVDLTQTPVTPAQERPTGYAITDADQIGAGGAKTKFRNNLAAIALVKQLDAEGRAATRSEQATLAKWVGWGGLSQAFEKPDGSVAKGWEKEAADLKEALSPEEYAAARRSTQDAHYTSPEVVTALWQIAERLGFRGGQVLEPSVGAGNFLGLMPAGHRAGSRITAVELDPITGGIAKHLYPSANVIAPKGFQDVAMPDGHFDLAIGNPPFGRTAIYDGDRRHLNRMSIHNYFFAKSLDTLRPGGVLTMVVSNFFMDSTKSRAKDYIASKADLIGAIRLPNTAFLANAGTEVTTDIVVLRKRAEEDGPGDTKWTEVGTFKDREGREVNLSRYFIDNPDMMLGEFGAFGSMYRGESTALIEREGQDTAALLESAIDRLPRDIMPAPGEIRTETIEVPREAGQALVGSYFMDDKGTLFERTPDHVGQPQAVEATFPSDKARERVQGMVRIRDTFARLRRAQIDEKATDRQIEQLRGDLNKFYDAFVRANGPINQDANKRLFRDDPTWPQVSALENNFDKGISAAVAKKTGETPRPPSAEKAPIFRERTQQPYARPTSAKTAKDALAQVLADTGRVDLGAMSRLYGKPEAQIIDELGALVYRDPAGQWETADAYLSGNVRQKLAEAKRAAENDPAFRRNVVALEEVQPNDIEAVDIDVKAGSPWVPANHVNDFLNHITNGQASTAVYVRALGRWDINAARADDAAQTQWGTDRATVASVVEAALNDRAITITDRGPGDTRVVNQSATEAANEKVERVKQEWRRWIWDDEARRAELHRLYNDTFNTDRLRVYDGSHLKLPGKVGDEIIELRPHQKAFVWRAIQSKTVLADHVVGAGKTFAAIAAVMEKRRIGQWRKPVMVVPNHLVGQWAADFVKLYPGARILAATKRDFEADNRKRFFVRMATGDWDAIIVAHSSFGRIGVDPATEEAFIQEQVRHLDESLEALKRSETGRDRSVKQIEGQRDRLKEKLKALHDQAGKDEGMTFDEIGIDGIVVDEAHEFKNLGFATSMTRIAGLGNPTGSKKAADLYMKIHVVKQRTDGSNIMFLTGTPISNTMAEMYTVQRYLDAEGLQALGVEHFDAWAKVFGEVVSDWELSPAGKYKMNSRFSRFVNIPELMQRYLSFADVISNDDIRRQLAAQGKKLPIPKVKGGKPQNVVVQRSRDQAGYIGEPDADGNYPGGSLVHRAENLPKKAEKGADNMLKVMSDARKAALDMRLIDPSYPDNPGSKIHVAADRMVDLYRRWHNQRGTQLVFIDLSTPKAAKGKEAERIRELMRKADAGDESAQEAIDRMSPDEFMALESEFSVYDDLKAKLIDRGIPAAEIAFIHDANTDLQKEELFGKVRSGQVRFLFGSTAKMGAGTNVQNRLVGLHHLDAPWRPSDLEQREGRIIRQGNELYAADPDGFEVEINRYATEMTLDSRMWQTIEGKARFIGQVRAGATGDRVIEDIGGEAANAAEMKAAASGNPMILEEMDLRQKLRKLDNQAREHDREQHRIADRLRQLRQEQATIAERMPEWKKDSDAAFKAINDGVVEIKGTKHEKPGEYGTALVSAAARMLASETTIESVGSFGAFKLRLENTHDRAFDLHVDGAVEHTIRMAQDLRAADNVGVGMKLRNHVKHLVDLPLERESRSEQIGPQIERLEAQRGDFPGTEELAQVRTRHNQVLEQLKPKQKPQEGEATVAPADAEATIEPEARRSPEGWGEAEGGQARRELSEAEQKEIADIVQKVSGLDRIMFAPKIVLPDGAQGWGKKGPVTAGGFYSPSHDIIGIALNSGTTGVAFHEAFHRLQNLFLTPAEKAVLKAEIGRLRRIVRTDEFRRAQVPGMVAKEIEAEAFAIWASKRSTIQPHKTLAAAWERIADMIRRVTNYLAGRGYQTATDIFGAAASGEIATRTPQRGKRFQPLEPQVAWHGTPHAFDRFSTDNVGTGEGAQAFGWGLYFASRRDVAEHYRKALSGRQLIGAKDVVRPAKMTDAEFADLKAVLGRFWGQWDISDLVKEVRKARNEVKSTREHLEHLRKMKAQENPALVKQFPDIFAKTDREIERYARALAEYEQAARVADTIDKYGADAITPQGRLVKVDIPENSDLLDWDAPLNQQSAAVQQAIQPLVRRIAQAHVEFGMAQKDAIAMVMEFDGSNFYYELAASFAGDAQSGEAAAGGSRDERAASRALLEAGIPGHRYLDGGSRADGEGSRNFVIYDDSRALVLDADAMDSIALYENADADFSITRDVNEALPSAKAIVADLKGKATDWTPAVLGAVPLNYFTELKRPSMSAVDNYLKVKRQMDAYRGRKHAAMDQIAQDWRKYARLGWGPLGRAGKSRAAELADFMHESTLAGIDPTSTDPEVQADPRFPALRKRFMAMPKAGRDLYVKVRDAYRAQADETDQILLANIKKAQDIAKEKAKEKFDADIERIRRHSKMSDSAKKMAIEDATKEYAAARTKADWSMKARLTRMRIAFEASRVPPPYFPLARFGSYFVLVKDVDGEVLSFSKRETVADRDRLAADMRKAFPAADVTVGRMDIGASARDTMDPRLVAEIENIVGGAGLDPTTTATMLDQIWQRYLETMPDLSVRKRFIHRKGMPGFEADALRTFASHMFHASHQMGRLKYGMDLQESVNRAVEQAKKSDDPTRGTALTNELRKRHEWVMNPTSAKWSTTINAISFTWMLGATPAAALINMTQTAMLGIPILGARLGGMGKASAALAKASADSIAGVGSVTRANLTADEKKAMEAFYESGLIDRSQAHDLAGVGETGVEYSPIRAQVMKVIAWMYHNAEVWNREVTALAAYRLSRDQGQDHAKAVDTAHDLTWKTHFDYSNASRARYLQGDVGKALFVFQSHTLNMTYRILRDTHQALKGDTPAVRREARYQLAGVLGMMSFLAGGTGVFGYSTIMALLQMFFGDDDDPMDFEQHVKKAVLETLGPTAGGIVLKGVPGHLLGIDLTQRIGMPYLWLRPESRELEGRAEFESFVMRALGANVGMIGNWWHGASIALNDGQTARGIEVAAPKFVKDYLKSFRYLNEGLTNLRGDEILAPGSLDAWDALAQAIGFTPARISETYERNNALRNAERRVMDRRRRLVNEFALAHRLGDRQARSDALDAIRRFNRIPVNRPVAITPDTLQRSLAARERNRRRREDGVLIQNERLGRDLRQMLPETVYR